TAQPQGWTRPPAYRSQTGSLPPRLGRRQQIATRPFQLRHSPGLETAFGGAHGRTDVAQDRRLVHGEQIQIDPMITPITRLGEINRAFDLMHEGKSIRSGRLLVSGPDAGRSNKHQEFYLGHSRAVYSGPTSPIRISILPVGRLSGCQARAGTR